MKVASNISQEDYERLMHVLSNNSPVQLSRDGARYYPYGNLACHVIGYVVMGENHGQSSN
jgi:cell division protein FtsI/penicillin-binding protein 2